MYKLQCSDSSPSFRSTMRTVKQKATISVSDFDQYIGKANKQRKNGLLFPNTMRCLITGPSNCGKTNILLNLIFDPNGLRFENIYVFSKSLYQPKYQFLEQVLPEEIGYFSFDDNSHVISPSEAKTNSIMIFDDIACEKHNNIRNYFTMGRHNNIDTFYLGQTYSKIPKQLIRDNCNFLIIFKQDEMNLRHVHSDHVTTDMSFDDFKKVCAKAWRDKYGFLVIDKDSDINKGRYRIGFDQYIVGD